MPRRHRIAIVLSDADRERFWGRVNKSGARGCWLWTGQVDGYGYGLMKVRQKPLKTHRIAWTLERGPIPDDRTLDHRCRVPACVNPGHLELVTNRENILRGVSPQAINARKTHCDYRHPLTPENLVKHRPGSKHLGKRHCLQCAREKSKRRH